MNPKHRGEDRVWASAFTLGIVGGVAWLLFEIGVVPSAVGIPAALVVALAGLTVVLLSIKEARRDGGSVGVAARRGARTLWEWVITFLP